MKVLSWFWDWKVAKPYFIIFGTGQLFILGMALGAWLSDLLK